MSMDLNREQKRQLKRMGALNDQGAPVRNAPRPAVKSHDEPRTTIPVYIREVRAEMHKVAWPNWQEVRKYALVVLVTVVIFTAYVGGLDALLGIFSSWLYR